MWFWLGTHERSWLARADVPLMVSRRRLQRRHRLPIASAPWVLDSGGFTELSTFGRWTITGAAYATLVERYRDEVGSLEWAAPRDHMCEPFILEKTGSTVAEHQRLTVADFLDLRQRLGSLVIPVLQGFTSDEYVRCWQLYDQAGVDLAAEAVVGLGSVCRRQGQAEAERIVRRLSGQGLRLHGFGVKRSGLQRYGAELVSADSLAWSFRARHRPPLDGCAHASCANCLAFALTWRGCLLAGDSLP